MNPTRVVVTGLGPVTSLGSGITPLWENLLAGKSGLSRVRSFSTNGFPVSLGGEIHDFDPLTALAGIDTRGMGRASQLALYAAYLALTDAGLDTDFNSGGRAARGNGDLIAADCGVAMGTTSGEPLEIEALDDTWFAGGKSGVDPRFVDRYPCHVIPLNIAKHLGLQGPNIMIPTACAAGNYAIGHAFDLIRAGRARVMLAGGADAFSRITYSGFAKLGAIADQQCQPFDKHRQGMVPGEGAALLVLESMAHAEQRGARIYAEVLGYGLSCDAHHITAAHPEGDGARRAMLAAIAHTGLTTDDIDYISAHGTGTPANDVRETRAVKAVFGERAWKLPMSSIKSMLGHTMGAASAIEACACVMALREQRVPPTTNYQTPDEECDLDYVANVARDVNLKHVMNNAYAFGGNNACVIFRAWEQH